ncbi:MAG: hypothetical protein D6766_09405 [Verrucomicrobia bacterium]|nr:MAG: hypothetical protein D6766_09405 [Verrucomicrobiota bacterium]
MLGIFNGGRGASDTWFVVNVPQPGYYPIRIGYYEGGGGANCEFFSLTEPDLAGNVTRTLVNDTGGIEAYQPKLDANGNPILTPYIKAFGPGRNGANAPLTGTVNVWIEDGATAAGPITMKYDGVEVTPTITKDGTTTHVMYKPDALLAEGQTVPVEITIGDRVASWSFTTETGDPPTGDVAFFIEAEDFNYNGGQSKPEASVMPYLGGAYSGLGAVSPTDYDRASEGSSPLYRIGEDPQVPMNRNGDNDRGITEVEVNLKIGWIAEGQTYVYTRDFPQGEYNVWAGLSHGDAPDSGTMVAGSLQLLEGGTATDLGTFEAPATGGWGNNDLVPLKDANGQMVTVALGGTQTVQFTAGNGDFDYLLFTLPGAPPEAPRFTNIQKNPDGSITIEWTGNAVLESAPTLQGPWTEVPGATSPFTFTPDPAQPVLFGRLRAQ